MLLSYMSNAPRSAHEKKKLLARLYTCKADVAIRSVLFLTCYWRIPDLHVLSAMQSDRLTRDNRHPEREPKGYDER